MRSATGERMIMGNHGLLVAAATVAEAFEDLYYPRTRGEDAGARLLDRPAAQRHGGRTGGADRAGLGCQDPAYADAHFAEMKRLLDTKGSDYAE